MPAMLLLALSACAGQKSAVAPPPAALRGLEAKAVPMVKEQPHFDLAMGSRSLRAGEGRWKNPANDSIWNKAFGWGPVVWVTENGATRVLDLRAEFPSYYVSHVFDDPAEGRIFLFLDYGIEGPAPFYAIWVSEDRGEHWSRGADLPRPPNEFPPSSLETFLLEPGGRGTAWLKLEAGNLSPARRGKIPVGADVYYRVTTPDYGRSWQVEDEPALISTVHGEMELH